MFTPRNNAKHSVVGPGPSDRFGLGLWGSTLLEVLLIDIHDPQAALELRIPPGALHEFLAEFK